MRVLTAPRFARHPRSLPQAKRMLMAVRVVAGSVLATSLTNRGKKCMRRIQIILCTGNWASVKNDTEPSGYPSD